MIRRDYENYYPVELLNFYRMGELDLYIIKLVGSAQKILDAGAGSGVLALKLKELGKDVTCIDIKKDYIEHMKKLGLNVIEGDVTNLPFKDNEFDLVICEEVMEHLDNPGMALKELCRVAKNVIFTLPKAFPEEWHLWDIEYIPNIGGINCLVLKMSKKEGVK